MCVTPEGGQRQVPRSPPLKHTTAYTPQFRLCKSLGKILKVIGWLMVHFC